MARKKQEPSAVVARTVFEIEEGKCELVNKSERLEKHGTEDVLACDLEFIFATDNGILACFAPSLKSALYEKPSVQGELVEDEAHLTALRFPSLGLLKWETGALKGAVVTFHGATGEKSNTVLEGVDVNKFRLAPMEGGTVNVHFRVQVSPLDDKLSGKLSRFYANKVCSLSVTPPQPSDEVQQELSTTKPADKKGDNASTDEGAGASRPLVH